MTKQLCQKLKTSSLTGKSFGVLALRLLGVALFFGLTLYLTNEVPAFIVGQYDFSRALLLFVGAIALFGMQQSVIFYSGFFAAKDNLGQLRQVYKQMVLLVLATALLLNIGLYGAAPVLNKFTSKPIDEIAYQTFFGLAFYALTMLHIDVLRALGKIYLSEIFRNILRYALLFVAVVVLVVTDQAHHLVTVFLLNFGVLALASGALIVYFFATPRFQPKDRSQKVNTISILKRSAPMAISATSFLLMQSLDVLMLKQFTDYESVAIYSVAVKLTLLVSVVLSSVNTVLGPQIAKDFNQKNTLALRLKIKKSTRLIFMSTTPIIIGLALLGDPILELFGAGYQQANTPLLILLAGQMINAFCGSVGVYLNMTNKQTTFQWIIASAVVVNVFLNWMLIPRYGMQGAAIATSASMIMWNVTAVLYVYWKDKTATFLTW